MSKFGRDLIESLTAAVAHSHGEKTGARVTRRKSPPLQPNAETIEAMQSARRGELIEAGKPGRLLSSLSSSKISRRRR